MIQENGHDGGRNRSMLHLSDWVDPYIGSIGHLLTATQPLVYLPHSLAQIRPVTDEKIRDHYWAPVIYGFPMNRAELMADAGEAPSFASGYDHDFEDVRCYRGEVLLEDSGIQAGYTVTERCAVYRFVFPEGRKAWLRARLRGEGRLTFENGVIRGEETVQEVPSCFAAALSAEPLDCVREGNALILSFPAGSTVEVRVGFSYIDAGQAEENLRRETEGLSYEAAANRAREIWDRALGRIEVKGGTDREKRIFYTSLYRVYQRMINISEYGRYYSGFDKKVHSDDRDFYTNDGIWDTYRGAHPLQLLLEPERQADMIHSYLRMYRQCGHMPTFPSLGGSRAVMIGKHTAAMITDAYMKGCRDFDPELAWEAMADSEENVTKLPWASGGVNEYDECYFKNGFFPALPEGEEEWLEQAHPFERRQCVAVTLETCYDEWCLAQFGRALGKPEAEKYARRAVNYRNVFNPETGFMSPKLADGSWVPDFDPKLGGGQGGRAYFAECNSWTYTLHVQHDVDGLAELLGGKKGLENYLDRMFTEQYGTSKYAFLGQFPDETGLIGQFCMGNEPGFHIPYLYNHAGAPRKTQRKVREIMKTWFDDTPLGICGDEDGGAMCAWYVFSAMGFYPVCPGKPEYDVGSPIFEEVKLHLPEGGVFTVRARNNTAKTKYIRAASLNGVPMEAPVLRNEDIVRGGTLELEMSEH